MTDLTTVFLAEITLTAAFVIPWLRANTTQKQREALLAWAEIAAAAAQQLYGQLSGEERKAYVLDFLEEKGYKVNTLEVENAIEAAVLKLHQQLKSGAVENIGENLHFTTKNVENGNMQNSGLA